MYVLFYNDLPAGLREIRNLRSYLRFVPTFYERSTTSHRHRSPATLRVNKYKLTKNRDFAYSDFLSDPVAGCWL